MYNYILKKKENLININSIYQSNGIGLDCEFI